MLLHVYERIDDLILIRSTFFHSLTKTVICLNQTFSLNFLHKNAFTFKCYFSNFPKINHSYLKNKPKSFCNFFFFGRNSKTRNTRVSLELYFIYLHIKFTKTFVNKYLWLYNTNLNRKESNLIPCLFIFISPKNSLQAFNAFCIIKKQSETKL